MPASAPSNSPRSLLRLRGAFQVLARHGEPMTLAQLSTALGSPKSSVLLLLRSMVGNGYLTHENDSYFLGPAIFRLAGEVLSVRDVGYMVRPFLAELAERTQESVYLTRIDREHRLAVYVSAIESPQPVRYAVPVGTTRPLYASAAGLALLASQDPDWTDGYLKSVKIEKLTERTRTDRRELRRRIAEVREEGVAVSAGEAVAGAGGVAAPLSYTDGPADLALLIAAPIDRFEAAHAELTEALLDVVRRASGRVDA